VKLWELESVKGVVAGHSSTNRDGDGNSTDGSSGGSSEITRLSKSLVRATGGAGGKRGTNGGPGGNGGDGTIGGNGGTGCTINPTGGLGGIGKEANGQPGKLLFSEDTTRVRAKKLKGQFWTGGGGNGVHHGIGAAGSYYPFINILDGGLAKVAGGGGGGGAGGFTKGGTNGAPGRDGMVMITY